MKVVVDQAVPFIQGVLEPFAEVVYKDGASIGPEDVRDAEALIIRTRTKCNAALLDGSTVKFIATATIGTDHIDLDYCQKRQIYVQNAAGCNAGDIRFGLYHLGGTKVVLHIEADVVAGNLFAPGLAKGCGTAAVGKYYHIALMSHEHVVPAVAPSLGKRALRASEAYFYCGICL